ncbi:polysaccharide deacetylase family protein [Roseibium algae]|uniref:Chitooligosaccharide deacetylase n=1 Tax=Roseibium algae TaxID=3123038 RepID=A0ABU8TQV3_9HYPH
MYLLNNLRRVWRELRGEPLHVLPNKTWSIAKPKLSKFGEEVAHRTGIGRVLGQRYRGAGVALMFHEIHDDVDAELRTGCDVAQLTRIIEAVLAEGREIVTIEEGLRRLADPESRPFALLTFDDAYRDNWTNALPVLEHFNAPLTLFAPTGMIDRSIYAWWLGLREVIKSFDNVEVPAMEKKFTTSDLASKAASMRQIAGWIGTSQSRADALEDVFVQSGVSVSEIVERVAMNAQELKRFSEHRLVTIGAHTQTHRFLSNLDDESVVRELSVNKAFLEDLLQVPVKYLAYPYGTETACGAREADIAENVGFTASFTTRPGHLFADHLNSPQLLPRIDIGYAPQSAAALASRLNGLHRAMTTNFGEPMATLA